MYPIARQILKNTIDLHPEVRPYLSQKAIKVIGGFAVTLQNYYSGIYLVVKDYLSGSGYITAFRNTMAVLMSESFMDAVYTGYQEAGAELPLDEDTDRWLSQRIGEERSHIDSLFERLKTIRPEISQDEIENEANSRAQGYSNTLDSIYQEARMRGSKNITLIFTGMPGKDSCPECKKLEGKRHRISWIIANGAIPAPGNDYFSCAGYRCRHYWMNPVTGEAYSF